MAFYDSATKVARAKRLAERGFECFANLGSPTEEELRYAEFEFQVYSRSAKFLAVKDGDTLRQSNADVCTDIRALVSGQALGSDWNASWEAALVRWEAVPPALATGSYVCPVIVCRVANVVEPDDSRKPYPDEHSEAGVVEVANVWSLSNDDRGRNFFVRDFSGMFAVSSTDPAYATHDYVAPAGIHTPGWLFDSPRSFMMVQRTGRVGGVVNPWRAMEFLPDLLPDAQRIRTSAQWRSLFRIVRATAEIECAGHADLLQGWDVGNISIPLFHYTRAGTDDIGGTELGGFVASLAVHDTSLSERFADFGLFKPEPGWVDSEGKEHEEPGWKDSGNWGEGYECCSGRLSVAVGAVISQVGLSGTVPEPRDWQRRFWRRPHFLFRIAMLCRTEPALRKAMWRAAVQRVRNVAWQPLEAMDLPDPLVAGRRWLGEVLTSELALAIVVRMHVFMPGLALGSWMTEKISNAWSAIPRNGRTTEQMQADFESRFCADMLAPQTSNETWLAKCSMSRLAGWPRATGHGYPTRLSVVDLYPAGAAPAEIPVLDVALRTSPFFSAAAFADPVADREWRPDATSPDRHLTASSGRVIAGVSSRGSAASFTKALDRMGIGLRLPSGHAVPAQDRAQGDKVLRQAAREAQSALMSPWVLVSGQPKKNTWQHALRPVPDLDLRWVSVTLWNVQEAGAASALRIGTDRNQPPASTDSRWQLFSNDLNSKTLYAFDQRQGGAPVAAEVASVDAQGTVRSTGTDAGCVIDRTAPGNFGVSPASAVAMATFEVFVGAMVDGLGLRAVDTFSVKRDANEISLGVAWLQQRFPLSGGALIPSEWSFYVEYLGYRYSNFDPKVEGWSAGPFGRHLLPLGLDLWGRASRGTEPFFGQAWAREALPNPKVRQRPTDLEAATKGRLWDRSKNAPPTRSLEMAAAMLNWPSLYRVRQMFRTEPQARRALYDVWRMGMRGVLSLPVKGPDNLVPREAQVYQLFQGPATLTALSYWRLHDLDGLRKALASPDFVRLARQWITGAGGDFTTWSTPQRTELFRKALVEPIADGPLKTKLRQLAPLPAVPDGASYKPALGDVLDLDDLELSGATSPPLAAAEVILIPAAAGSARIGILASPVPQPAVVASPAGAAVGIAALAAAAPMLPALAPAPAGQFQVKGLVLGLADGRAIPLLLPEPVDVELGAVSPGGNPIDLYWTPDSHESVAFAEAQPQAPLRIRVDASGWLGDLGEALTLWIEFEARSTPAGLEFTVGLVLDSPWLRKPVEVRTPVAALAGIALSGRELVWRVPLNDLVGGIEPILPVRLDAAAALELAVGLDNAMAPTVRLSLSAAGLRLPLGSPSAALVLQAPSAFHLDADLARRDVQLTLPVEVTASLELMLGVPFPDPTGGQVRRVAPTEGGNAALTIDLGTIQTAAVVPPSPAAGPAAPAAAPAPMRIDISDPDLPKVPWALIACVSPRLGGLGTRLLDVADEWIAGAMSLPTQLDPFGGTVSFVDEAARKGYAVEIPLSVGPLQSRLKVLCTSPVSGDLLDLGRGFTCEIAAGEVVFTPSDTTVSLGPMARLELPATLKARLDFSGSADLLTFVLDSTPIRICIPAESGFAFDVDALSLGRGGMSLHARVHEGSLRLPGLPAVEDDLVVEAARDDIGEITIRQGRLIAASLRARTRLRLFDDADGVLSVRVLADDAGLSVLADLDVGVNRVFHMRSLCLQVQVDSVRLGLAWREHGGWSATGGLTGSARFDPEGELSGRLAEYANLLDGTSVHFENLDLGDLGRARVQVQVTPRSFEVGSIFEVVWRGLVLNPVDDRGLRSVTLLGDIAFKAEFPGMQAELSLGDITFSQRDAHSLMPRVQISSIGVKLRLDGGFRFAGRLKEFDDAQEYGFGGEVSLESGFIPPANVLLKLTRIRDGSEVLPSIAVYGEIQRNDHLGYGFFLRRVGVGLGVRQGLRGFSDPPAAGKPWPTIAQRVQNAIDSPLGLPYPGRLESWLPLPPSLGGPQYLLAGYGLVSFGIYAMDKDHPFVGSLVIAIDERLSIVAGLNAWFLASPDAAKTDEFLQRPAMKGALGFSPREQMLYGRFITMKDPRFGPTASGNAIGALLREALNSLPLACALYADAHGSIVEVAWPRQARFSSSLGPASGSIEAGFRFGFYRGTQAVGLNVKANAELKGGFEGDLGFANVSVSATATFELVASFGGAFTSSGQLYVFAQVSIAAALELAVHIWKRIRVRTFFCSFNVTLFDVSASLRLTISASLAAAIVPDGIGFEGTVSVSLNVAGFGFRVGVRVAASEGRIGQAQRVISELMPPIDELINAGSVRRATARTLAAPAAAAAPLAAIVPAIPAAIANAALTAPPLAALLPAAAPASPVAQPRRWRYFPVRVGDQLRVVLYPDGDARSLYPRPVPAGAGPGYIARTHSWRFTPFAAQAWRGLVGRADAFGAGVAFSAVEGANEDLLPLAWVQARDDKATTAFSVGEQLQTLEDDLPVYVEVVDPRTQRPVPGDFDDPAVAAFPARRSTRFRARRGAGTYDEHVARAAILHKQLAGSDANVTLQGELLLQLLALARDGSALGGQEIPPLDAQGVQPDARRLPAQLGLVLAFDDPVDSTTGRAPLETALQAGGIAALFEADSVRLLDEPVALNDVARPVNEGEEYQIVPGYSFQANGEVGITWTVLRIRANGDVLRDGPASHAGIESFRIQRVQVRGAAVPPAPPVLVRASWLTYRDDSGRHFAIRPQFQHLDRGLPVTPGISAFEYRVDALAQGGKPLTSQVMRVTYQPMSQPYVVQRAQVLLRMARATGPSPALAVQFDVAIGVPGDGTAPAVALDPRRIRLRRRKAEASVLGRYGEGLDLALSMTTQAVAVADGVQVGFSQPAQMRQLSREELDGLDPVSLNWTALGPPSDGSQHYRVTAVIRTGTEKQDWDAVLGANGQAGEFHVFVDGDEASGQVSSMAMQMRHAVAFDPVGAAAVPHGNGPAVEPELFSSGSEVSLLERVPLAAVAPAPLEALPLTHASFKAEVARGGFVSGSAAADDVEVRLRGVVSLPPSRPGSLGPIVALKVWCRDVTDAVQAARQLAHVNVEPELVFRALPSSVIPRSVPGDGQPMDWQPESELLSAPWVSPPPPKAGPELVAVTDASGRHVVLHVDLVDMLGKLDVLARSLSAHVRFSVDEPLVPAAKGVSSRQAVEQVLKRSDATSDPAGWRLIESLGGAITCWLECDGERLDPQDWENFISAAGATPDPVAVIDFTRFPPGQRPHGYVRRQWGVRMFSWTMLTEIDALRTEVNAATVLGAGRLCEALRMLAPLHDEYKPGAPAPEDWQPLLTALGTRSRNFLGGADPTRRRLFWQVTSQSAPQENASTLADPAPGALAMLDGKVHLFHPLAADYARKLNVWVEVVRRYQFVSQAVDRTAGDPPARVVKVPRTLALAPDQWAVGTDERTGAFAALVGVHPAQRAALSRTSLRGRAQFVAQRVSLRRRVADSDLRDWVSILDAVVDFKAGAWRDSWKLAEDDAASSLEDWAMSFAGRERIARGFDRYRYPHLTAAYRYSVDVRTQAGVRESPRGEIQRDRDAWLSPMFVANGDLRYKAPALDVGDPAEPSLQLDFALVRAADSLDPALWPGRTRRMRAVLNYWLRHDEPLALDEPPMDGVDRLPMQLPDLRASYVVVARHASRKEVIELAHVSLSPGDPGGVTARLLVAPYTSLKAALVQVADGPEAGCLSVRCSVDIVSPDFSWLRHVGEAGSPWTLSVQVQRDGTRFGGEA